jgi:plastocyanin
MDRKTIQTLCLLTLLASAPAYAGSVSIEITGTDGKPAANAVVELAPDAVQDVVSHLPNEAIIDQREEMFIPLVSLIKRGGRVIFTNHDTTMHQVYSFSPIKQFEFEIDQGQRSQPVVFDKSGVSSIGCNIHDQMITFVYVAESPWAAITDAQGHARIENIPDGGYHASVWHPQLMPGNPPPATQVSVSGADTKFSLAVSLLPGPMPGMKHMHMQMY